MIKFVAAAVWVLVAALGAVYVSFQMSGQSQASASAPEPSVMGGLDYVKTDVISVPLVHEANVQGYFLSRLVYTVDPKELAKLVVPADALITDVVYSYVYSNPVIDFTNAKSLDLDGFREGIRKSINAKVGQDLVKEVLIEQIDYLSKNDIRANTVKRRTMGKKGETKPPAPSGHGEAPAAEHH
jgi:flagellar basal body-associated protein FliL